MPNDNRHTESDASLERYSRQMLFAPIGDAGQRKLLASRVVLIGCGALGSVQANTLVRAGVGFLRIIDRDVIELDNLQRQVLFDEDDVAAGLAKVEAARRTLERVNSDVTIEPVVAQVDYRNIVELCDGVDLLLDGTDNFATRFLINDLSVKTNRPWVFGAVAGALGRSMPILPKDTPCLRCVFEQAPPPEKTPTAQTHGILGSIVNRVGSHQALEAMKILMGRFDAVDRRLLSFDAWSGHDVNINVQSAYDKGNCPCCKGGCYDYLEGRLPHK